MSRYTPHVVYRKRSPNQSSRGGVAPQLIVLHSTESDNVADSISDLVAVANYLAKPSVQASSNVIVDGDGHSARLVDDSAKAWAQAGYNAYALSIEQIGRAKQTHWSRDELREAARWIARWSRLHHIPIRRAHVDGGRVTRSGVLRHMDLGRIGGGHADPGQSYPLDSVLGLARFYASKI